MFKQCKLWMAAGAALIAFDTPALMAGTPAAGDTPAGGDALLDTMVEKGLLTRQEEDQIIAKSKEKAEKNPALTFANNLGIEQLTLFGDLRVRYESRDGSAPAGTAYTTTGGGASALLNHNDTETRNRARYRLRLGVEAKLMDDWFAGIGFSTNPYNQRSGNVTFGDTDSSGPFGKSRGLPGVNLAYIGWKNDWLTVEGGMFPNTLYTSNMIWDPNINPVGLSEQLHHRFDSTWEVFANFNQNLYAASPFSNTISTAGPTATTSNLSDIFQMVEQVGMQVNFTKDVYAKAAVGVYNYTGTNNYNGDSYSAYSGSPIVLNGTSNQPSGFAGPFIGDSPNGTTYNGIYTGNVYAVNNLNVIDLPAELDWKAWNLPWRAFGDFAINADADQRAALAMHPGRGGADGYAYQAGLQVGNARKKGDWQSKAYWQRVGTYAIDPNLTDADIFDGRTNMQGVVLNATYQLTDSLAITAQGAIASRIDGSMGTDGLQMGTPGTGQDLNLGTIGNYKLGQIDLLWKF